MISKKYNRRFTSENRGTLGHNFESFRPETVIFGESPDKIIDNVHEVLFKREGGFDQSQEVSLKYILTEIDQFFKMAYPIDMNRSDQVSLREYRQLNIQNWFCELFERAFPFQKTKESQDLSNRINMEILMELHSLI